MRGFACACLNAGFQSLDAAHERSLADQPVAFSLGDGKLKHLQIRLGNNLHSISPLYCWFMSVCRYLSAALYA